MSQSGELGEMDKADKLEHGLENGLGEVKLKVGKLEDAVESMQVWH